MKVLTSSDVLLLAAWHVFVRTLWAGAVIVIAMLAFDAGAPFLAKLMVAGVVMVLVWLPWLALTVWMAKSGIPKSAHGASYASLSDAAKARLIAAYSGFG
jgi:hypothetical protein